MERENETINLCVIVGSYPREAGVMLCSLYENTAQKVNTYIFTEGLEKESEEKLKRIAQKYGQSLCFLKVEIDHKEIEEIQKNSTWFKIAWLYRLKVADVLPEEIEKAIMIGTDLIFHIDIAKLWNVDMGEHAVMGVQDASIGRTLDGYIDSFPDYFVKQSYINVEVVLLDLQKIRGQQGIWEQAMDFLNSDMRLVYKEQDAVNYIFRDQMGLLDAKYNMLTTWLPGDMAEEGIYHFAGDHALWKHDFARHKFYEYLLKTPWAGDGIELLMGWIRNGQKRIDYYKSMIRHSNGRRKCFWGIGGVYFDAIMEHFNVEEDDFFVDINSQKWGTVSHGKEILAPAALENAVGKKEGKDVIVIVLISSFAEVAVRLKALGLREDEDFFDGKRILPPGRGGEDCAGQRK